MTVEHKVWLLLILLVFYVIEAATVTSDFARVSSASIATKQDQTATGQDSKAGTGKPDDHFARVSSTSTAVRQDLAAPGQESDAVTEKPDGDYAATEKPDGDYAATEKPDGDYAATGKPDGEYFPSMLTASTAVKQNQTAPRRDAEAATGKPCSNFAIMSSTSSNQDHVQQNSTSANGSLPSDQDSSANGTVSIGTGSQTAISCDFGSLTGLSGRIQWQGDTTSLNVSWVISLPNSSYGIMLTVHEVNLDSAKEESLSVYRGPYQDPSTELKRLTGRLSSLQTTYYREYSIYITSYTSPVAVLFVPSDQAMIRVFTRERSQDGREEHFPRVEFSYTAVPTVTVPPQLANGRYNCSPPHEIPSAWRCDLARQCDGGEDEENFLCEYSGHCGNGSVAFENICLQFEFPLNPLSPTEAAQSCKWYSDRHKLLSPQDPELMQLVARVTLLNGHEELMVDVSRVDVKVRGTEHLYRFLWQWGGFGFEYNHLVIYGQPDPRLNDARFECGILRNTPQPFLLPVSCSRQELYPFVCSAVPGGAIEHDKLELPPAARVPDKFPTKQCSDGSHTHHFHPCPEHVLARDMSRGTVGFSQSGSGIPDPKQGIPDLPKFQCRNGALVDYSLTCDAHDDCGDGSDEHECGDASFFTYDSFSCKRNPETISSEQFCDGIPDCHDGTDEEGCISECKRGTVLCEGVGCLPVNYSSLGSLCPLRGNINDGAPDFHRAPLNSFTVLTGRFRVDMDGYGMAELIPKDENEPCPEAYFQCEAGVCIPVYLVNNQLIDCPLKDYDAGGDRHKTVLCPGYYRCYGHEICLHNDHLCDGIPQCPLKDDERYCDLVCPPGCSCQGLALTCDKLAVSIPYWARYLDMSGVLVSQTWLDDVLYLWHLQLLNLSSCGLHNVSSLFGMHHVTVLDLSYNHFTNLSSINIEWMSKLAHLNLSHNPLLPYLDASLGSFLQIIGTESLRSLAVQDTGIAFISAATFTGMTTLNILDLRENRIGHLNKDMFAGLESLQSLYADDPKICCSFFYRNPYAQTACHAPQDELSSCDDLLRSDFFRGFLWTLSALAVTGNVGVFIYRLFLESAGTSPGFRVLVANLCFSDFLMGVYLMMIGSADVAYRGRYLWEYEAWTRSAVCHVAGFLALASCEVSAFLVCLITLDRLIMLQFPLKPHLHLTRQHIIVACVGIWIVGAILATVPLLPLTADWEFYSQTGICLPLPITQQDFPGQQYAFGVFIVLNFGLFALIGSGQLLIYRAIRSTRMAGSTRDQQQDMTIARRLFLIVISDFCCWFPIGLMGLLAARGTPIPGVVNVWSAIFVLPLNSALNPFLYTLATLLERRRKLRRTERVQRMLGRLHVEISAWPKESLKELFKQVERALKTEPPDGGVARSEQGTHGIDGYDRSK